MIISESALARALETAISTGADFAEVYAENTLNNRLRMIGGKIENALSERISGAGVRVYRGTRSVYASTSDLTERGLLECARKAAQASSEARGQGIPLLEHVPANRHPVRYVPSSADKRRKAELLRAAHAGAAEYAAEITQTDATFLDADRRIVVANSDGLLTHDRQIRARLLIFAVASRGGENQMGLCGDGRMAGLEMFEGVDPGTYGRKAAKQAVTMLNAGYCPAGRMAVAIENGFGGVIFHEACGHSLEATSVAPGRSQFAGKIGQKIAGDKVTAIDDGTIPGEWGSVNIDDEGAPSRRTTLIENGVLRAYLVDRLNARKLGMEPTGSARREDYTFEPTSRMTNTYIANGPDKNDDIIRSIDYGLYAKEMGGGSVNPVTGEFNFAVREGYLIRHGEIQEAVRGASLVGTGAEILQRIDMVGQNQTFGQGLCGSVSGSIPVNVGQPLIRVSCITVGGRE